MQKEGERRADELLWHSDRYWRDWFSEGAKSNEVLVRQVAKFGLEKIMAAMKLVKVLLESLTDTQRKEIVSDSVGALMTIS